MNSGHWLRAEGLVLALGGAGGYFLVGGDPLVFLVLVIAPNVSMAGYLLGNRVGSVTYNVVHALVLPVFLLAWGVLANHWLATAAGLAWIAHVGADRAFGFGLKYADSEFRDTHLQRV